VKKLPIVVGHTGTRVEAPVWPNSAHRTCGNAEFAVHAGVVVDGSRFLIEFDIDENRSKQNEGPVPWMNDISMQPHLTESRCHGHRLMGHDPDFSRKITGLHREPDRGVHGPDPSVFEPTDDFPCHVVDTVAGVMELKVGDRPSGASYRLPVHAADHADENLGRRKDLKDARSLRGDIRPVNPDEADIICPGIQAQATEFFGGERVWARLPCLTPEGDDRRMLIERSHRRTPGRVLLLAIRKGLRTSRAPRPE
jgi:hypothetical protein